MDDFDVQHKPQGIVFEKNGNLQSINVNNENLDPLIYVLMYPRGDQGWKHNTIKLNLENETVSKSQTQIDTGVEHTDEYEDRLLLNSQNETNADAELLIDSDEFVASSDVPQIKKNVKKKMEFVTALQYYSYQLCDRPGSYIHRFGRLFHQFIVDQIARIESARLKFFYLNQDNIRADLYQNVKDSVSSEDLGKTIGNNFYQ